MYTMHNVHVPKCNVQMYMYIVSKCNYTIHNEHVPKCNVQMYMYIVSKCNVHNAQCTCI